MGRSRVAQQPVESCILPVGNSAAQRHRVVDDANGAMSNLSLRRAEGWQGVRPTRIGFVRRPIDKLSRSFNDRPQLSQPMLKDRNLAER